MDSSVMLFEQRDKLSQKLPRKLKIKKKIKLKKLYDIELKWVHIKGIFTPSSACLSLKKRCMCGIEKGNNTLYLVFLILGVVSKFTKYL